MPRVSRIIDAPPGLVWRTVSDLGGHDRWQVDVRDVTITSDQIRGVGTTYVVQARLGPIRMRIPMEVTDWDEGRFIAVRYEGRLRGRGRITLQRKRKRRTKVTWRASVGLPWRLGSPLLRRVWRKNLENLAREVEAGLR